MIFYILCLKFLFFSLFGDVLEDGLALTTQEKVVLSTKQIAFKEFPGAHNPSIFKFKGLYLLSFRYLPNPHYQPQVSQIAVVLLSDDFEPVSSPQLLPTRRPGDEIPSQAEDARIFSYRGRLFLIYNDCQESAFEYGKRRDMVMAELFYDQGQFSLSLPLKLFHVEKYPYTLYQKNWVPFEYQKHLYMGYTIEPHEILKANLSTGECHRVYETTSSLHWPWGQLRGSSAPQLVDGEYFAFFHSGLVMQSSATKGEWQWHYFMGAYTFSAEPPFQIKKISKVPIVVEGFYTQSDYYKKVIFPGGFVVEGNYFYVAYSKDDREIWIAKIDKEALRRTMQ